MDGLTGRDNRMNLRPHVPVNRDLQYSYTPRPPPQYTQNATCNIQYELPQDGDELSIDSHVAPNNPNNTVSPPNQFVNSFPLRPQVGCNVQLREQLPYNYAQLPQTLPAYYHGYSPPLATNYPANVEHSKPNEITPQLSHYKPISGPQRALGHQEYFEDTQIQLINMDRSTSDYNMRECQLDPSVQTVNLIWKKEFETHAKNIVYIDNSGISVVLNNHPRQPDRYEAEVNFTAGEHFGQLNILGHELFETYKYFVERIGTQQDILLYLQSLPHVPKIPFPAHFSQRPSLEYNISKPEQAVGDISSQTRPTNEVILQLQRQRDSIQEDYENLNLRSANRVNELNAEITSLKEKNQQLKQESTKLDEALICKILEVSELEIFFHLIKKYEKENDELKEGIFRINNLFNPLNTLNSKSKQQTDTTSDLTTKSQFSNIVREIESLQSHSDSIENKLINALELNSQASLEVDNLKQELSTTHRKILEQTNFVSGLEREKIHINDNLSTNEKYHSEQLICKMSDKPTVTNLQQAKEPTILIHNLHHKNQKVVIQKENQPDIQGHKNKEVPELIPQKPNREELLIQEPEPKNLEDISLQNPETNKHKEIPLSEEINQKEIPLPISEEINMKEIPLPINEEINQKEIPLPIIEEINQKEIPLPINEEINQKEIPLPINEEINQKEIPLPIIEEINQNEIPLAINEELLQEEIPLPINNELFQKKEVRADAKWTGNNEYKILPVPIKKLKAPELFTNVNRVKTGCVGFKVKIKEVETTLCKITTYSYAKPNDFIGQEVFCRPTNREYECGILRVIFTAKVFTSTVHRNTEYAGIKFLERVGNSDGCYKGDKKQYFQAEAGFAVFLPLTDISVRFKAPVENTD